jgi:ubiquinone/menaquinone biosynthesis C-methylase UbiE
MILLNTPLTKIVDQFITGHETVLEAGCGSGRWMFYVHNKHGKRRIYGIDFSRNSLIMINSLKKKGYPFELIRGDLFKIPLKDDSVSFIISSGVVEHFEDPTPLIKEMYRVLEPEGTMLIMVPNRKMFRSKEFIARGTKKRVRQDAYTPDELASFCEGMNVIEKFSYDYAHGIKLYIQSKMTIKNPYLRFFYDILVIFGYQFFRVLNIFNRDRGFSSIVVVRK